MEKLNLGCGNEIFPGTVNVDSVALPGVDVVHDLSQFPWPFKDSRFGEITLKHVLEHLPNTVQVMDELWRICAPAARVTIRVPYWNSSDYITDPTHIRPFNEHTFDFFNPDHPRCKERSYYSKARFKVAKKTYHIRVLGRYFHIRSRFLCSVLELLAHYFSNVIQVMEYELEAVKSA